MSGAGADEEDEAAALAYSGNNFRSTSKVSSSYVERDYVDALSDAEYVPGVCGVPVRGGVAEMGLRGKEKFEGYIVRIGWVCQKSMGLVMWAQLRAEAAGGFLYIQPLGCDLKSQKAIDRSRVVDVRRCFRVRYESTTLSDTVGPDRESEDCSAAVAVCSMLVAKYLA